MSLLPAIPEGLGPLPLSCGGTWSAQLESINPRLDDVYYWVTRQEVGGQVNEFFVKTAAIPGSRAREGLIQSVTAVVERGATNTDYNGSLMWRKARDTR